jgi:hypothetical protein
MTIPFSSKDHFPFSALSKKESVGDEAVYSKNNRKYQYNQSEGPSNF